ncbi:kelch-like protein 10 [Rhipicephalus sanguineus]|uniref:kelch-like protein 10 n=1 Tax=Rhipicephalus sanguineus TaxID=34632 RepID=UPI0020C57C4B|nr:kelch-like protein 10 [Rhipicephalus sanguineus]
MAYARCYVSVAVLQGQIYAMGGFDGRSRTRTVERYDIKTNQWSMVADMIEVRSDASAAAAHGRIYIAGGFTGATVLDSVECYDPSTNAWTRIVTMSSPRSGAKVVSHKDMLYIIGGYNGVVRLASMEQLDCQESSLFRATQHAPREEQLCRRRPRWLYLHHRRIQRFVDLAQRHFHDQLARKTTMDFIHWLAWPFHHTSRAAP